MRKLATIRVIEDVKPIEGADRIVAYNVGGWWVVDQKDAHEVGSKVVYFEIDSWVPHELAPFLSKGSVPREYEGIKGNRLRTIRLKGQLSQGLICSIEKCIDFILFIHNEQEIVDVFGEYITKEQLIQWWGLFEDGRDVSDVLRVQKWEAPIHASLGGIARGNFPFWARKTDQERVQNLKKEFARWVEEGIDFEISIKLDGSSMSVGYSPEGEFVVCSRNLMLDLEQEGNMFVNMAKKLNLKERLAPLIEIFPKGFLIQGELIGENIQGNKEGIKGHEFHVFDVFSVGEENGYVVPGACRTICSTYGLYHVPVLHSYTSLRELGLNTIDDVLAYAEGHSLITDIREGIVFKMEAPFKQNQIRSFKAISNTWLLKYKD